MQKNLQSCSFPFFMWSMFSCCYLSFVIISQSIFILKTKIIKFRVQNVCDFRTISDRCFARTIAYCIFSCASSTQQLQLIIIGNFAQVQQTCFAALFSIVFVRYYVVRRFGSKQKSLHGTRSCLCVWNVKRSLFALNCWQ